MFRNLAVFASGFGSSIADSRWKSCDGEVKMIAWSYLYDSSVVILHDYWVV